MPAGNAAVFPAPEPGRPGMRPGRSGSPEARRRDSAPQAMACSGLASGSERDPLQGRPARYALSVAPVAFATAATMRSATASICTSVSVASRGCSVTWMARLTLPSGSLSPA